MKVYITKFIAYLIVTVMPVSCGGTSQPDPVDEAIIITADIIFTEPAIGPVDQQFIEVTVDNVRTCTVQVNGMPDPVSPCEGFDGSAVIQRENSAFIPPITSSDELQTFATEALTSLSNSIEITASVDSSSIASTQSFDVLAQNTNGVFLAMNYDGEYAVTPTFVSADADYLISTGVDVRPEVLSESLTILAGVSRIVSRVVIDNLTSASYDLNAPDLSVNLIVVNTDNVSLSNQNN